MKKYYIYKINSPIGGVYVGRTTNWSKRMYKHRVEYLTAKKRTPLQESFMMHGFESHKITLINETICNEVLADYLERHFIRLFASCRAWNRNGLNVFDGGKVGARGKNGSKRVRSIEEREKQSSSIRKYIASHPERSKAQSELMHSLIKDGKIRLDGMKINAPKFKNVDDGNVYSVLEISKKEGMGKSGINYHINRHGHYKNKYYPCQQ